MDIQERKIVLIAGISHATAHFYELLFPAMTMYVTRSFDASIQDVIKAGFFLYFLYGFLALPWGVMADRFGSVPILGVGMIMAGMGAIFSGFAESLGSLWVSLGIIGIGISTAHPAGMSLVSRSVAKRGRALGIFGIWGNLGIVVGPLVGGIGGYFLGWQKIMIVTGIAGMLAGIFVLGSRIEEEQHSDRSHTQKLTPRHAIPCFLVLCIAITFAGVIYRGNLITIPVYLEEKPFIFFDWLQHQSWIDIQEISGKGVNIKTLGATLIISFAVFVGMIGQKIGGYMADRVDLRWGYFVFFLMGLPALGAIAISDGWQLVLALSIFMVFSLGMQPIENSLVARLTPARWRSTAYGAKFILGFGVGAMSVWLISFCMDIAPTYMVYFVLMAIQMVLLGTIGILILISRGLNMKQYG